MKTSVIIPSANEQFLNATINDVLAKAAGEIEVIVVLDGYWPGQPPPRTEDKITPALDAINDPRVVLIHKGVAEGMRPAINDAASVATGDYLLKLDAHCLVGPAFDEILKAEMADNWVVVPRRYRLDPYGWTIKGRSDADTPAAAASDPLAADNPYRIDYHYLSYPFDAHGDGVGAGLHGQQWNERTRARTAFSLDDEMSSQGSCWFMRRDYFFRQIGPLDSANYGNFIQEFQEIGLKCWLSGGAVKLNKRTYYGHLFKGKDFGRGYWISKSEMHRGAEFARRHWMLDSPFPGKVHDLKWLIEHFNGQGLPVPTWPADLDDAFAVARRKLAVAA